MSTDGSNWFSNLWGSSSGIKYADAMGTTFNTAAEAANSTKGLLGSDPGLASSMVGKGLYSEVKTDGTGIMGALSSDSMKGAGVIGGLGMNLWDMNTKSKALSQAKSQWEAENARADKILAMNTEKFNQYKADRDRLNSQYS